MGKYDQLRVILLDRKREIASKIETFDKRISRFQKVEDTVKMFDKTSDEGLLHIDTSKIIKLKKSFPYLSDRIDLLIKIYNYLNFIIIRKPEKINNKEFEEDLIEAGSYCSCKEVNMALQYLVGVQVYFANKPNDQELINSFMTVGPGKKLINSLHNLIISYFRMLIIHLYACLSQGHNELKEIIEEMKNLKEELHFLQNIFSKLNQDKALIEFTTSELEEVFNYLATFMDKGEIENLRQALLDSDEEEKEEVTFSNLDMSLFSEEEQNIIETIREIVEDEDLDDTDIFNHLPITLSARKAAYEQASMMEMLSDVKNNLIKNIYTNKDDVLSIFRLILSRYQKYSLHIIRSDRVDELLKIKKNFTKIISIIQKNGTDYDKVSQEIRTIHEHLDSLEAYLQTAIELRDTDYDEDEFYDEEIEKAIRLYHHELKEMRGRVSIYYQKEEKVNEYLENTNNLVFCLEDDIDLTDSVFQSEFSGTIDSLEYKTSRELKGSSGRKGMSRLRKTLENGKEKDFVEYLESKYKRKFHFVPYRYSSERDCRTGLIKFEPSAKVKEFLEEEYGLSSESAFYGVFKIISVVRANHSEYSLLEEYVMKNLERIEELALLFTSEEPDKERLRKVLNSMIQIKRKKIESLKGRGY